MRRVAIIASASGNGKTTLGRELASRLDVPFVEMDAIVHGPNCTEICEDGFKTPGGRPRSRPGTLPHATTHFRRRRAWPAQFAGRNVIRLRTPQEVERWLSAVGK